MKTTKALGAAAALSLSMVGLVPAASAQAALPGLGGSVAQSNYSEANLGYTTGWIDSNDRVKTPGEAKRPSINGWVAPGQAAGGPGRTDVDGVLTHKYCKTYHRNTSGGWDLLLKDTWYKISDLTTWFVKVDC